MELIRGLHNLRGRHRGCVATVGNFDGVHQGHRTILRRVREEASRRGLPALLMTFEPQPQEYFAPQSAPPRLTRLREKLELLQEAGVDRVLCLRFNDALARLPAAAFVEDLLVAGLGVQHLVVGDDFRFGAARMGDFAMLAEAGENAGFTVEAAPSFELDGARVSSTRIRQALGDGDMALAERLLGRPYHMSGRVAHGDKRGRAMGYPTANIHLHRQATPVQGVYVVEMTGVAETPWPGVANVGNRPTFDGTRTLLEVYLLDFDGDIYGRHVQVRFLNKLRDEERYDSTAALVAAIDDDVVRGRAYFANGRR